MDSKLSASMAALRKVVKSPHPAMFWQETMGHVAVILDHLQELVGDGSTGTAPEVQPSDHSELRRIAVALKNPVLNGQEASDLMVRYEALTMPDHIIALIDGQSQRRVSEGWKLVPSTITTKMMTAAYVAAEEHGSRVSSAAIALIYGAAVAAAPFSPIEEPSHG
ncbi:TPA: hypothetical protein NHQ21_002464 [Pseudomonas aeruginosa]|uniref:hypothetical protein n=1 Tax=Pseudomonas aeruginosa TaxID=287 RepID=UPI00196948AE|nr:hypothetical protein [Pseudomonas aeruginosa]MEA8567875.1 hypothetical protein [Pseudomonas aeruginosa]MEA8580329.1 hypothetical protein [Pseudomonas aeruginosa]MEA8613260.1 hypothetical protein [Pseudomonas aeruginosa]HBO3055776.1 hypothetical protein [Pseudomonas aeruginosa]HCE7088282.1 hypothetical protein [Pseudomonas aeruginosa]